MDDSDFQRSQSFQKCSKRFSVWSVQESHWLKLPRVPEVIESLLVLVACDFMIPMRPGVLFENITFKLSSIFCSEALKGFYHPNARSDWPMRPGFLYLKISAVISCHRNMCSHPDFYVGRCRKIKPRSPFHHCHACQSMTCG